MFCFALLWLNGSGQMENDKLYDIKSDTLLVLGPQTVNQYKLMMTRQAFLAVDTFRVNQKGLVVAGFRLSGFALGNHFELSTNNPFLSDEMKNTIINEEVKYKFIYIKDLKQFKISKLLNLRVNNVNGG